MTEPSTNRSRIPALNIKARIPEIYQDAKQFMMFRYQSRLPVAGVRANDTFHVVWIEPTFGNLYDHG